MGLDRLKDLLGLIGLEFLIDELRAKRRRQRMTDRKGDFS